MAHKVIHYPESLYVTHTTKDKSLCIFMAFLREWCIYAFRKFNYGAAWRQMEVNACWDLRYDVLQSLETPWTVLYLADGVLVKVNGGINNRLRKMWDETFYFMWWKRSLYMKSFNVIIEPGNGFWFCWCRWWSEFAIWGVKFSGTLKVLGDTFIITVRILSPPREGFNEDIGKVLKSRQIVNSINSVLAPLLSRFISHFVLFTFWEASRSIKKNLLHGFEKLTVFMMNSKSEVLQKSL